MFLCIIIEAYNALLHQGFVYGFVGGSRKCKPFSFVNCVLVKFSLLLTNSLTNHHPNTALIARRLLLDIVHSGKFL